MSKGDRKHSHGDDRWVTLAPVYHFTPIVFYGTDCQ
jgi:hypothetical protein